MALSNRQAVDLAPKPGLRRLPAIASWIHAVHQFLWKVHNTRVGMNSCELHESIGMVLTDTTLGHSKDTNKQARHYPNTHGMAAAVLRSAACPLLPMAAAMIVVTRSGASQIH